MKRIVRQIIEARLIEMKETIGFETVPWFEVEVPRKKEFGDFSTNAAMMVAKMFKKNPREVATGLCGGINHPLFARIEIAGPGFINFYLDYDRVLADLAETALTFNEFLSPHEEKKKKIMLEYVSANPTGPLHVGHGRGACVGSALALILKELGHEVWQEFYVNDAGAQVKNLGISIILRARQTQGETVEFPDGCYLGEYVTELAADYAAQGGRLDMTLETIDCASAFGRKRVMEWIGSDLADFGVSFDAYLSERGLFDDGHVANCITHMEQLGLTYKKDGALWFRSTAFGDDKDRVLAKESGEKTYFASDVAYHRRKFERGFDTYVNLWGADHHGYVPRIKSAITALGFPADRLHIVMVQMVSLFRDGKPVTMSKRTGEFVTLREVVDEVGKDAARFMFLTRRHDSPLDFDIDLVKQKTSDNPVFYVQYMYARINSVFAVAKERGFDADSLPWSFNGLVLPEERELVGMILSFPDVIFDAARQMEPHVIAYFLIDLAQSFHAYYNAHRFINEQDRVVTASRLNLLRLLRDTSKKGLCLLGIESPERM